jgi:hypothetical protein
MRDIRPERGGTLDGGGARRDLALGEECTQNPVLTLGSGAADLRKLLIDCHAVIVLMRSNLLQGM